MAAARADLIHQISSRSFEEELKRQMKLLKVVLTPEIKLHRAGEIKHFTLNQEKLKTIKAVRRAS